MPQTIFNTIDFNQKFISETPLNQILFSSLTEIVQHFYPDSISFQSGSLHCSKFSLRISNMGGIWGPHLRAPQQWRNVPYVYDSGDGFVIQVKCTNQFVVDIFQGRCIRRHTER